MTRAERQMGRAMIGGNLIGLREVDEETVRNGHHVGGHERFDSLFGGVRVPLAPPFGQPVRFGRQKMCHEKTVDREKSDPGHRGTMGKLYICMIVHVGLGSDAARLIIVF